MPKIILRVSAYPTGASDPKLDERAIADTKDEAIELAKTFVEKAINGDLWEMIIDLYHETEKSG